MPRGGELVVDSVRRPQYLSSTQHLLTKMSPAGVSMFYAALDETTALAETYVRHDGEPAQATIATFRLAMAECHSALQPEPETAHEGLRVLDVFGWGVLAVSCVERDVL
jgi:hypothetical protein